MIFFRNFNDFFNLEKREKKTTLVGFGRSVAIPAAQAATSTVAGRSVSIERAIPPTTRTCLSDVLHSWYGTCRSCIFWVGFGMSLKFGPPLAIGFPISP
jgi:hypothetical protein